MLEIFYDDDNDDDDDDVNYFINLILRMKCEICTQLHNWSKMQELWSVFLQLPS